MALERARAEDTPFPPPDISSPRSNFANLSFIISVSAIFYVIIRVLIGNKLVRKTKKKIHTCLVSVRSFSRPGKRGNHGKAGLYGTFYEAVGGLAFRRVGFD